MLLMGVLCGLNFCTEHYFIKPDYIARTEYCHFDDTSCTDGYQNEVYLAAFQLAEMIGAQSIGDVGCGSGFKLLKYFKERKTVGFEIEPTLSFLKERYPDREWMLSDFGQMVEEKLDVVICSDVIEHLTDPDQLLNWMGQLDFNYLVLSTPDRDQLIYIQQDEQCLVGPPLNPAHVREWSFAEFETYVGQFFDVQQHFHTEKEYWGQVIIAIKKHRVP